MTAVPLQRTCGAVDRTGVALMRTGGARDRACVALQRTGDPPDRTGGEIERSEHVLPLEPAAAHTAGPLIYFQICSKGALTPNWTVFVRTYVRAYVRACVRTSRWKILFTPHLVVQLSPCAEIRCVYATSINDGTQILTILGIHNNRDFLKSRFFCGNLIILNPELH